MRIWINEMNLQIGYVENLFRRTKMINIVNLGDI